MEMVVEVELPVRSLWELRLHCEGQDQHVFSTTWGGRRLTAFSDGTFEGAAATGTVVQGLANDWGRYSADGRLTALDAQLVLHADDTDIFVTMYGRIDDSGAAKVAALFEVAAGPYEWLNDIQAVGVGTSDGGNIRLSMYAIGQPPSPEVAPPETLPATFLFKLTGSAAVGDRVTINGPLGSRYMSTATAGGTVAGSRLTGRLLQGFAWAPHRMRFGGDPSLMHYDVQVLLETEDRHRVLMRYRGLTSPAYTGSWPTAPVFEAEDGPYEWLNGLQTVAHGRIIDNNIEYDVYAL